MASKKLLKKRVKRIVDSVMDDCDYHIVNEHPKADAAEKLMDEVVDFYHKIVPRINTATSKKDFKEISSEVDTASASFTDELNSLA